MSFVVTSGISDDERRHALRRMKTVALGLLLLAAVIYAATLRLDRSGAWGYVNTGAEAAMVGALADWFAVTALFKHPLGIPIPHTAIVPTKKDEIAGSLQQFFTDNFLTEEIARDRLATAQVSMRLGTWLSDEHHAQRAMTELVRVTRAAVSAISDDEVREFADEIILPRLVREPVSAMTGDLLAGIVQDGAHHGFVDLMAEEAYRWLRQNPQRFAAVVQDRMPWWAPGFVNDRVVDWSYEQALDWLRDVRRNPQHPTRRALDDLLCRIAEDLQHDPSVQRRAEALKARLLTHPQLGDTIISLWQSLRASLFAAMDNPRSQLWSRGVRTLQEAGDRLTLDAVLRERIESRLGDIVSFFVATYGRELSDVISHTIQRWDGEEAGDRIELYVGRDLQFIRINGTVVGCLAGLVIHAISMLVS